MDFWQGVCCSVMLDFSIRRKLGIKVMSCKTVSLLIKSQGFTGFYTVIRNKTSIGRSLHKTRPHFCNVFAFLMRLQCTVFLLNIHKLWVTILCFQIQFQYCHDVWKSMWLCLMLRIFVVKKRQQNHAFWDWSLLWVIKL